MYPGVKLIHPTASSTLSGDLPLHVRAHVTETSTNLPPLLEDCTNQLVPSHKAAFLWRYSGQTSHLFCFEDSDISGCFNHLGIKPYEDCVHYVHVDLENCCDFAALEN